MSAFVPSTVSAEQLEPFQPGSDGPAPMRSGNATAISYASAHGPGLKTSTAAVAVLPAPSSSTAVTS